MMGDLAKLPETTEVTDDWIGDWDLHNPLRRQDETTTDVAQLSADLCGQLSDLRQGASRNICPRYRITRCGLRVWRAFCLHYKTSNAVKIRSELSAIMSFTFPKDNFHSKFTAWETLVAEYEEQAGNPLHENVLIAHIINNTKGPLLQRRRQPCRHLPRNQQADPQLLQAAHLT